MTSSPHVDIVVNNHNYGRFVGDAIDSALAQTYPDVSVIVVDDGSTDDSRERIASFGDRIAAVLQENAGQAAAFNAGLDQVTGEIVVFLDADDVLLPHAAEQIAAAFSAKQGLARVHYRLALIDESGARTGEVKPSPHIVLPSGDLRSAELTFPFDLARPATSGNAFSADTLRAIAPIRDCGDRIGADWYVVHLANLHGDVGAIDEPLACYRLHGSNLHETDKAELDLRQIRATIGYTVRTRQFIEVEARRLGLEWREDGASMSEVADRTISRKLDPARHPVVGDATPKLLLLGLRAAHRRFDIRLPMKIAYAAWLLLFALAPRRLATWLAELFVFPEKRTTVNRAIRLTGKK